MLIDNAYLQIDVINKMNGRNGKFHLDYQEFSTNLCREIGAERFRTYIYDASEDFQEDYFVSLSLQDRFEIRKGVFKDGKKGRQQKQVDILLAIDMIRLALKNTVQHIILVSNDSDFIPAVQFVKEEGIIVHLRHADNDTYSRKLSQTCDTSMAIRSGVLIEFDKKTGYRQ